MLVQGQVGPIATSSSLPSGAQPNVRLGNMGDQIVSEIHGRFYEAAYRGTLFNFGLSNTALAAANAIATGLTASAQPIIGIWNPNSSLYNLVILQASVVITTIANTAVAPGGFMWVSSTGNSSISTGSTPLGCKLGATSLAGAKAFAMSTALTGLTNNLAVLRGTGIAPFNAAGAATAVSITQGQSVENVDGSIIVPPGGVAAIMNQVSTTTCSASVGIIWEEVPV